MTAGQKVQGSPSAGSWATLAALGFVTSLFALFLWSELVVARSGGIPFCASSGNDGCVALWDSSFAIAVHRSTGLPVAGWGLCWGLVAFAMPLLGLLMKAEGKPFAPLVAATRFVAGGGVLSVLILAGVSAAERTFCIGCVSFYALVFGYAGIALFSWADAPMAEAVRGVMIALGALALSFALLLIPGQRTPQSPMDAGRAALLGQKVAPQGDARAAVQELIASLDPGLRQTFADALAFFRRQEPKPMARPRFLIGPESAPVRITDFTDVLCPHCAELEKSLEAIERDAPEGSFALEPRQFPLDGSCNRLVQRKGAEVRCVAARVKICAEGRKDSEALSRSLFDSQDGLTVDRVYALAFSLGSRKDLERCAMSDETGGKLSDDIRYAAQYSPDGTPIVLVNGRLAPAFPPLLYALILTRGDANDPAFDALPPPAS